MLYTTSYSSPLGKLNLVADDQALVALWLAGQDPSTNLTEKSKVQNNLPIFSTIRTWLDQYFAGQKPSLDNLALAPAGGEFRQKVWKILREIPYGETITYGEIAKKIIAGTQQKKMAAQAVGGAVGHNPISIIIPCHRVMGRNGQLVGYYGGIEKKRWLLQHEGIEIKN